MKYKVKLSYTVELFVEGKSEETVQDWLNYTTPSQARELAGKSISEDYNDEILCRVADNSIVDYIIP